MASLIGQTIAILACGLLVRAVLARAGVHLTLPRSTAIGVAVVLALVAVSTFREQWHTLDLQRTQFSKAEPYQAKSECAVSLGADPYFVAWVSSKVPPRERYWMPPGPSRGYAPDICMRMILIPRTETKVLDEAGWAVLWGEYDVKGTLAELRRRGGKVYPYNGDSRDRFVVQLP